MNDVNFTANNKALAIKIYMQIPASFMFSLSPLHGNAAQALANPNSIVLSQNTAVKFFGTDDIVGNIIQVEEGGGFKNLVVSGVAKNPPSNSSIQFDAVVPFSFLQLIFKDDNWLNQYLTTFILLKPFANSSEVETKFSTVLQQMLRVNWRHQAPRRKTIPVWFIADNSYPFKPDAFNPVRICNRRKRFIEYKQQQLFLRPDRYCRVYRFNGLYQFYQPYDWSRIRAV